MKTIPSTLAARAKKKVTIAGLAEWLVLGALFIVAAAYFLRSNGFISPSDIQPYPY